MKTPPCIHFVEDPLWRQFLETCLGDDLQTNILQDELYYCSFPSQLEGGEGRLHLAEWYPALLLFLLLLLTIVLFRVIQLDLCLFELIVNVFLIFKVHLQLLLCVSQNIREKMGQTCQVFVRVRFWENLFFEKGHFTNCQFFFFFVTQNIPIHKKNNEKNCRKQRRHSK